ncbi:hypothetical protein [Candidatus Halobonum tyrrellensis]|uniref:Glycosyltransferase RgtA/B/C/D-like domain-containing protein n=1 Tax=Candidatus Halobonum tyrrellensis G22 TaxID=1324957 RepID=V4HH08_9EURY|nr:hypothetical protein [Candidatus Halobonum tyrrellensis]ESP90010.1 hypothetical protein K933_00567 [Candidatus Halobonum tyrrellensis G22]
MNWKYTSVRVVRKYAAIPVALFCLLALYVFVSIGYRAVLGPVLGGVVGGLVAVVALVLFDASTELRSTTDGDQSPADYRISIALAGLYVTSILVLYRLVSYQRPWVHYAIFGGYAGYVAYDIATGASRRRVVAQLLVLTFVTYWSTQFAFPAGMYGPDTKYRYLPAVRTALTTGYVSLSQLIYLGHLTYVTATTVLMGVSAQLGYYLLSVVVLTGTLLVISVMDVTLPAIPDRVALYAALIFGCMSWTLGRGFQPNKLNFFYPLIILVGIATFGIFIHRRTHRRWLAIAVVVSPAIIFGHQFSAGAALVFLLTIGLFTSVVVSTLREEYRVVSYGSTLAFVAAYGLGIFGNPIHSGALLGRIVGLFNSIFAPAGGVSVGGTAAGGPGRYSQLPLDLLLVNTAAQALLFALAVFGAAVALRRSRWEFDFGIAWMGVLAVLLLVGLVFNSADTQPQRFYSLLGLFGLNVFAGVTLVWLCENGLPVGRKTVAGVVAVFCVLSLVSPVAGMHLSPSGDRIPHFQRFDRSESIAGEEWRAEYVSGEPTKEYRRIDGSSVTIDTSGMVEGSVYTYDLTSRTSGVVTDVGLSLGGRQFAFVLFDQDPKEGRIYTNGRYDAYRHG